MPISAAHPMSFKYLFLTLTLTVLLMLPLTAFTQEHTYFRDSGSVKTVAYSPVDSSIVASGGGSRAVNLWNLENDTVTTLGHHADTINAVAFSPDGNALISGGDDATLRIWDVTPYRAIPEEDMVRIVYFLPRDRSMQPDIWNKLNTLIRDVQRFYADEMARNGFGRKTFTFETDENRETRIYRVDGQHRDWHYHTETHDKVYTEIATQFDMEKHAYLIVADISSEFIHQTQKTSHCNLR
ncbi:hypothetical protein F4054_04730 [Candidatus Poribacteria bacterium]|nr:hypothetical protein [Candidatus Poribacteria bacterium]MYG08298.1 hypothetical protein [Candidatus Poribacteria bacterium]MYK21548.1 hypothetical protein [Candidatus Poribacteria bacterium]